jgi:hypothetical protein
MRILTRSQTARACRCRRTIILTAAYISRESERRVFLALEGQIMTFDVAFDGDYFDYPFPW